MRAVTVRDKQLRVEDHPDPSPGSGEVLVRVRAAGLIDGGANAKGPELARTLEAPL